MTAADAAAMCTNGPCSIQYIGMYEIIIIIIGYQIFNIIISVIIIIVLIQL